MSRTGIGTEEQSPWLNRRRTLVTYTYFGCKEPIGVPPSRQDLNFSNFLDVNNSDGARQRRATKRRRLNVERPNVE